MFKTREASSQIDMFNNIFSMLSPKTRLGLEKSTAWHNVFFNEVYSKIDERIFEKLYSSETGRANQSIRMLVSMLILKEGQNLTDEQLFESLSYDLRYVSALGQTSLDYDLPCPSTYYSFKQSVVSYNDEHRTDLFGDVFTGLAKGIVASYNVDGDKIRMDSKLFSSNIARSTRLQLLIKCIQKWRQDNLDVTLELSHENEEVLNMLMQQHAERITFKMSNDDKHELTQNVINLLAEIKNKSSNKGKGLGILERLCNEQLTINEAGEVILKDKKLIDSGTIQSPYDTDAAYRLKVNGAKKQEVNGYVSNITETYNDKGDLRIVTSIETKPANKGDEGFLINGVERSKQIVGEVKEITTDGAYHSQQNQNYIKGQIDCEWNLQAMQGDEGLISINLINEEELEITINETGEKQIAKKQASGKYKYKTEQGVNKYILPKQIENYKIRQKIKQNQEKTCKERANVESTIAHGFYTLKDKKTKYRGIERNHLFVVTRYIWVNFRRLLNLKVKLDGKGLIFQITCLRRLVDLEIKHILLIATCTTEYLTTKYNLDFTKP